MDYAMLIAGIGLLFTCTLGTVSADIWTKICFRLIPLVASIILLLQSLTNLAII